MKMKTNIAASVRGALSIYGYGTRECGAREYRAGECGARGETIRGALMLGALTAAVMLVSPGSVQTQEALLGAQAEESTTATQLPGTTDPGESGVVVEPAGEADENLLRGEMDVPQERPPERTIDDMRQALLAAIAGYPDELLVDIFEVAQEPEALAEGEEVDDPVYQEAVERLEEYPEVLNTLKKYPYATAAVGEMAREDIGRTWRIVDEERSEMTEFYERVEPLGAETEPTEKIEGAAVEPLGEADRSAEAVGGEEPRDSVEAVSEEIIKRVEEGEIGVEEAAEIDEEFGPSGEYEVSPPEEEVRPPEAPDPGDLPSEAEITAEQDDYRRGALAEAKETQIVPPLEFEVGEDTDATTTFSGVVAEAAGRAVPESAVEAVKEEIAREEAGVGTPPSEQVEPPTVSAVVVPPSEGSAPSPITGDAVDVGPAPGRIGQGSVDVPIGRIGGRPATVPRTDITGGGSYFGRPQYTEDNIDRFRTILRASRRDPNSIQNVIRSTSARHERHFSETNQYFSERVGASSGSRAVRGSATYSDTGIPHGR